MLPASKVAVIEDLGSIVAQDDELAVAAAAGDEAAFAQLFTKHKRMVASIAGRFFQRREQIEEIIQTSFYQAYVALPRYQGGQEKSFTAWLARIAMNVCFDELRRQQRRKENLLSDFTDEETEYLANRFSDAEQNPGAERQTVSKDLAQKLLAKLAPEDRVALTLLYEQEWSIAEIAAHLGWSSAKVKGRAYKARLTLQKVFKRFQ